MRATQQEGERLLTVTDLISHSEGPNLTVKTIGVASYGTRAPSTSNCSNFQVSSEQHTAQTLTFDFMCMVAYPVEIY